MTKSGALRRSLDLFYKGCGALAGFCLVGIAAVVMLTIAGRPFGFAFTWTPEYAGYAMASMSFLGLAYTFNTGGQVRVGMMLNLLPSSGRRWLDGLCLAMGLGVMAYFTWSSVIMTMQSHEFNDVGQGVIPVPLWIPQTIMSLGLFAQVVALADNLICLILYGTTHFQDDEAAAVG